MKPGEKETQSDDDAVKYAPETSTVGAEVGAVSGAIAGAALGGVLGGPAGALTGAALGATVGAFAGFGIAEGIDPQAEEEYWQKHYRAEPYVDDDFTFEDYGPAYRLGWQQYNPNDTFESAEEKLSSIWAQDRSNSQLDWDKAKEAAKASWQKVRQTSPPESRAAGS
ncbi:MAG: hypothetical protein V4819_24545 [Verrucomicrobiota bacterium]